MLSKRIISPALVGERGLKGVNPMEAVFVEPRPSLIVLVAIEEPDNRHCPTCGRTPENGDLYSLKRDQIVWHSACDPKITRDYAQRLGIQLD